MISVVYILAASHSGSTLLAMLLGSHRDVCTVGELKATSLGNVDHYRCSCGELIRQCAFWERVGQEMGRKGAGFNITEAGTDLAARSNAYTRRLLRPLHRGLWLEGLRDAALWFSPHWRRQLSQFLTRNYMLIQTVSEVSNARVVVDSSKVAVRLKYLLRHPDLDVRVIHLVRDGRGVALAHTDPEQFADAQDPALRGGGCGDHRDLERRTISQAAYEWVRSNQEAEHLLTNLQRSRWIKVRYEDLCCNTDPTLERIFRFLRLDPVGRSTDFRGVDHHVLGNGMRLDMGSPVRLDQRWKTRLSAEHLRAFAAVAGATSRRYGYSTAQEGTALSSKLKEVKR